MRNKGLQPNIDNSDLINFPNGRIKNNDGSGNGTPVNEQVKGDIHEFFDKMLRLYGITHNGLPDNEANGYQSIEALRAVASKNDFILTITSVIGVLNVPVKLGKMLENEQIVCKVSINKTTETEIKGSDNSQFVVTFIGDFKANEYVRLIKTASGVIIVRLVDLVNLDTAVSEFLYLKKANQTQEDTGTTDLVATTPLTNKTVFVKRVNGIDSSSYLATPSQNGLLSSTDKIIIDSIGASPIRNKGWFSGLDVAADGTSNLPVSGDILSAVRTKPTIDSSKITVTLANAMDNTNYLVQTFVEGQSSDSALDDNVTVPVFKIISTTVFEIKITETFSETQNLRIHIKTEQL